MKADTKSLTIGFILGLVFTLLLTGQTKDVTSDELITEFYQTENAVSVSPHDIRTKMSNGDTKSYILVDVRTKEEYEEEHIASALNIPIFIDESESGISDEERIVRDFKKLKEENPNTEIIMYCYSAACMATRKVGLTLAENGIAIKHLNIGWYEWRYFWDLWNGPDSGTDVEDYIVSGDEPGIPSAKPVFSPCAEGEFSC